MSSRGLCTFSSVTDANFKRTPIMKNTVVACKRILGFFVWFSSLALIGGTLCSTATAQSWNPLSGTFDGSGGFRRPRLISGLDRNFLLTMEGNSHSPAAQSTRDRLMFHQDPKSMLAERLIIPMPFKDFLSLVRMGQAGFPR